MADASAAAPPLTPFRAENGATLVWSNTHGAAALDPPPTSAGIAAEMEPGDVLVYPALWWHQVEALEPFNVLVNYWWNAAPGFVDTPMTTLLHGLLSLRDRPDFEKQGWKALFDYYVFGPADRAGAAMPEAARGPLGPMDETKTRRLRAHLLDRLNR